MVKAIVILGLALASQAVVAGHSVSVGLANAEAEKWGFAVEAAGVNVKYAYQFRESDWGFMISQTHVGGPFSMGKGYSRVEAKAYYDSVSGAALYQVTDKIHVFGGNGWALLRGKACATAFDVCESYRSIQPTLLAGVRINPISDALVELTFEGTKDVSAVIVNGGWKF